MLDVVYRNSRSESNILMADSASWGDYGSTCTLDIPPYNPILPNKEVVPASKRAEFKLRV